MTIKKILLGACLVTMGSALALPAMAGPAAKTYEVQYAKADMATAGGSARVFARISETAQQVCVDEFGMKRFVQKLDMQRCVKAVTKDLMAKVNHENVDKAYAANSASPAKTKRHASK